MAALCKIKNGVKAPRKFAENIMLELVAMPNQEDDFINVLIDENGHFELVDQDDTSIQ